MLLLALCNAIFPMSGAGWPRLTVTLSRYGFGLPKMLTPDDISQVKRLIALTRDLVERYAHLAEVSAGVFDRLNALEGYIREFFEEASQRLDDIETLLLLERTGHGKSAKAKAVRERMQTTQDRESLKRMLNQQTKNLNRLREKQAWYGGTAPLDLLNQIDDVEESIRRIEKELYGR